MAKDNFKNLGFRETDEERAARKKEEEQGAERGHKGELRW
jgi:hypothetical protein